VKKSFKNRYFLVGGVAQAAKCLPSKCKALSSNPIPPKNNYQKSLSEE
jgi:hypothetical protein